MEKENIKIEEELVFPEESSSIIDGLLEKYGLIKNREEETREMMKSLKDPTKKPEEKIKILESFPSAKLAQVVADYGCKKISLEKIPLRIEKELNIETERAKKITEELKTTLFDLIKTVKLIEPIKEKKSSTPDAVRPRRKTNSPIDIPKKAGGISRKDTYREPIE